MSSTPYLKRGVLVALAIIVLILVARPAISQNDEQDVLKVIPENYKLLFENAFVRVIEARVPPGTRASTSCATLARRRAIRYGLS